MSKLLIALTLIAFSFVPLASKAARLPHGNYEKTCRACVYNAKNDVLHCICRTRGGRYQFTRLSIPRQCRFIQNVNGNLRCTDFGRHKGYKKEFRAGPIRNHHEAKRKCARICRQHNRTWNGQWHRINPGMAVCECIK